KYAPGQPERGQPEGGLTWNGRRNQCRWGGSHRREDLWDLGVGCIAGGHDTEGLDNPSHPPKIRSPGCASRDAYHCVTMQCTMPWSTAPSSLFLAAGQANQIAFGFADVWAGPQYATAKLDHAEGGTSGGLKILVVQWQGTATESAFGLPSKSK